jgi:dipeptidyl aminopeptidase/acylaminoacyl peptidase
MKMSSASFARALVFSALLVATFSGAARGQEKYQVPPKGIVDLVDVTPTPSVTLSPAGKPGATRWLLIQQISGLPPISDLAQPELRLAGLRFNPKTNGPSRGRYSTGLSLQSLPDGKEIPITGLPPSPKIRFAAWSPDATKIAFANISDATGDAGLSLWIVDVATAKAQRVPGVLLNAVFGTAPCEWISDSTRLLCQTVPTGRGAAPVRGEVPEGPIVQENLGRVTPGATFEDLLKDATDETIFDYYATSQVAVVSLDGAMKNVGKPGVIAKASASPDANYALITEKHRPYTYLLPYPMFPERTSVTNLATGETKELNDRPLQDSVPNMHDAAVAGPRDYDWRSDAPATLSWVEAADGGDPRKDVPVRDTIYTLAAPFTSASAAKLVELPLRFEGVTWTDAHTTLVDERRWKDRKRIILAVADTPGAKPVTMFEGSFEDRYNDPGTPFMQDNAAGKSVGLVTKDGAAVFRGNGASPKGDVPFVAVRSLTNGTTHKVWESAAGAYELPLVAVDPAKMQLLIRRETPTESPNYFLWSGGTQETQVTKFPNPYGNSPLPVKQVLKYTRADGVELSANLYVPPGYKKEDGPLPTLIEAYPAEFKTRASAGQITGSPYEFVFLYPGSPVPFVATGYAVMENASIPIIGEGSAEPNDTYVEQLVASAKAAIDEGVRLGVVDRNRVAVMGHSYGAFMTVNLVAHSDFFKAGIARSGAYNRTLTPFGFQNEDRTYWQAPAVYNAMSPFMHADQIKTPLLLIHGEADNNSGTFPIQSERLFAALKGQGATVRFVLLPLEAHGYAARESVLDMFWEMNRWMDTYVKNWKPGANGAAASTPAK